MASSVSPGGRVVVVVDVEVSAMALGFEEGASSGSESRSMI